MAKYCRSCGATLLDDSRFCEACGTSVAGGAAMPSTRGVPASPAPFAFPAPAPARPHDSNRWVWLVVAGVAFLGLVVVGGAVAIFIFVRSAQPTAVATPPPFIPPPSPTPTPDDDIPWLGKRTPPPIPPDAREEAIFRVPVGDSPQRGPTDALVTIVEFQDFQCPFCGRVQDTLERLERERGGRVRIVFKHNPLPFHQNAMPAAEASMAAAAQGKFWEMHRLLFANQSALGRADLERYASEIGLDLRRFRAELDGHVHTPRIEADKRLAADVGARGTPTFFVNGRVLTGAQPIDRFLEMVDEATARAQTVVARGVATGLVYDEIIRDGRTSPLPTNVPTPPTTAPEDPNRVFDIPPHPGAPVRGAALAPATLVEFADFECPFSARVQTTLTQLERDMPGRVRIEFRHFPLPFHSHAQLAHEAAAEANAQGRFWQYHDVLFQNQRALERADLERYAARVGLDVVRFRQALDDHRHAATIRTDVDAVNASGARTGTPSFFLRGKLLRGAQPIDALRRFVEGR